MEGSTAGLQEGNGILVKELYAFPTARLPTTHQRENDYSTAKETLVNPISEATMRSLRQRPPDMRRLILLNEFLVAASLLLRCDSCHWMFSILETRLCDRDEVAGTGESCQLVSHDYNPHKGFAYILFRSARQNPVSTTATTHIRRVGGGTTNKNYLN